MRFKFVGIGGSLKSHSSSAYAMHIALRHLQQRGHVVKGLTALELSLPLYGTYNKLEDHPENVHQLLSEVRSANGLIFSSPIYHGSLSGVMKNVMDYFEYLSGDDPPYLSGKVAALISTSGGGASVSAINIMDQICRTLHAWVCPTSIVIPLSSEKFDSQGNLTDGKIRNRLLHMTDELEFAVTRFHK